MVISISDSIVREVVCLISHSIIISTALPHSIRSPSTSGIIASVSIRSRYGQVFASVSTPQVNFQVEKEEKHNHYYWYQFITKF